MVRLYKIKPLKWEGKLKEEFDSLNAYTPFGSYTINLNDPDSLHEQKYLWSYCFDEYYDEGEFYADTLKEAKKACQKHWEERLSDALTQTKSETNE